MRTSTAAILALGLCGLAHGGQETFVDDYESGDSSGGWSYWGTPGVEIEIVEETGGNPGAFLHTTCPGFPACLDTFAAQLRTLTPEPGTPFLGNYREMGVTSIGVDLITFFVSNNAGGRPISPILRNDMGTPDNLGDDAIVHMVGSKNMPFPGQGWMSYDFDLPATSTTMPDGWQVNINSAISDPDEAWNTVIENVTNVTFFYGNPEFFFIFQQWDLGADNVRISFDAATDCFADCNDDGELNILDFTCFQALFVTGDEAADCNDDGELNILDFTCFQAAFEAGC